MFHLIEPVWEIGGRDLLEEDVGNIGGMADVFGDEAELLCEVFEGGERVGMHELSVAAFVVGVVFDVGFDPCHGIEGEGIGIDDFKIEVSIGL